jgi:hypothetical protein
VLVLRWRWKRTIDGLEQREREDDDDDDDGVMTRENIPLMGHTNCFIHITPRYPM